MAVMRKCSTLTIILLASMGLVLTVAVKAADQQDIQNVVRRLAPAVVQISGYMGQDSEVPYAEASGFFVEKSGFLLTVPDVFTDRENHRLCERFKIRLFDGRLLEAKIFSVDPVLNLAILKVVVPGPFPTLDVQKRVRVHPGDTVLALAGWETNEPVAFAVGYVTAKEKKSMYGAGFGDMLINCRIQITPETYGGPLVTEHGDVVGIMTRNIHLAAAQTEDSDHTHALPVNVAMGFFRVAKAFPTSQQNWIGISVRPMTPVEKEIAYSTLGKTAGLYVDFVWAKGPAAGSDIHLGDILFEMNGKALSDIHELNKLLFAIKAGDKVDLAILRDGRGFVHRVTAEMRPAWAAYVR